MEKLVRVNIDFYNLVNKFIDDFEKVNNIRISFPKATKIIQVKIKSVGGLTV